MKSGATSYLTKPVDADQIVAAFESSRAAAAELPLAVPSPARVEFEQLQPVLADCDGNVSQAARVLGIYRSSLQRQLAKDPLPETGPS